MAPKSKKTRKSEIEALKKNKKDLVNSIAALAKEASHAADDEYLETNDATAKNESSQPIPSEPAGEKSSDNGIKESASEVNNGAKKKNQAADTPPEKKPKTQPEPDTDIKFSDKPFLGKWWVKRHIVNNLEYSDYYQQNKLNNNQLLNSSFEEEYEFNGRVCLKTMDIKGDLHSGDRLIPYKIKTKITFTYEVISHCLLRVYPESGYLKRVLGKEAPVIRELESNNRQIDLEYAFKGNKMILKNEKENEFRGLVKGIGV